MLPSLNISRWKYYSCRQPYWRATRGAFNSASARHRSRAHAHKHFRRATFFLLKPLFFRFNHNKHKAMVRACCVVQCTNRDDSKGKEKGLHFFRFPKDVRKRRAWIRAINRKNFAPNEFSCICSEHFEF